MWYISSNIVVPFMLGVNIIWTRAGRSPANNLHSRFPYRLVLKLMPQDDIYRIIDQVSQQLSSHAEHYSTAEPSVTITHDTHYTHSVAVLNLSWQHSGKLLVFFANFCLSQSKLPIEKRPREARFSPSISDHRPANNYMRMGNTSWVFELQYAW